MWGELRFILRAIEEGQAICENKRFLNSLNKKKMIRISKSGLKQMNTMDKKKTIRTHRKVNMR